MRAPPKGFRGGFRLSERPPRKFWLTAYSLLPPNMPPRPPSTSPALSAMPPSAPPAPPARLSSWPAIGSGRRVLRKPSTVSTAPRACCSLMPVRSTTCLISSSIFRFSRLEVGGLRFAASDEDDGLEVRDVEAPPAARAREHVVHAHHEIG